MSDAWRFFRKQCEDRWKARGLVANPQWQEFQTRLDAEWDRLKDLLGTLYADRPDFAFFWEHLIARVFDQYCARSERLKRRDRDRPIESAWFQDPQQIGAVAYVDRFAGTFRGLEARAHYLRELGVTVLHLMPFFRTPEGESDGGYAVSSYREPHPALGTMDDVEHLAARFEDEGMTLAADFVFNHTSDEHEWALKARAGDPEYQDYYWMFSNVEETRPWQANLRDIFPEVRRGSFTWFDDVQKWVWTTFNRFQWDLNYRNPAVFSAMAEELLRLANRGFGIIRLDAVAFTWKDLGTNCENRPNAHVLIQAFQSVVRLACPSVVFLSEAIVHPDEIIRYISTRECPLSYNPLLMAELWEAAATKEVRLLAHSLRKRHSLPPGTAWVNYVRCHDDIGWTFADEDAAEMGINGYDHRQFLNRFYTGDFPGTFSRGVSFQFHPETGDRRICGSAASLAGLEKALEENVPEDAETGLRRLLLLYTVVYTAGGLPWIYLGDEVAVLNRYEYENDPAEASDSRWVHRPHWDEKASARRHDPGSIEAKVFGTLVKLGRLRSQYPALGTQPLTVLESPHPGVLVYEKGREDQRVLVVASFADQPVTLDVTPLRDRLGSGLVDLMTEQAVNGVTVTWTPCQVRLLVSESH